MLKKAYITLKQLIDFLTVKPAESFSSSIWKIRRRCIADIVLIDLETEQEIDPEEFVSKGKNTPFTAGNERMASNDNCQKEK